MSPLVSVIMPSYNAGKFIGEAIDSILQQTYENWELIIIEDCSSDNSLEIIQRYKDSRIKVFYNRKNRGISETTNKGIQESKGKYIALLDDDDIAEKERLSLQVEYLEQYPEIDILGGRTKVINEQSEIINFLGKPRNNPKYIKAVLLFSCMDFMNSTAMIRRDFIENNNLYYRNGCYGMQDFRFYIESSKVGNISTIENFLLKHRVHAGNETERNLCENRAERAKVYAEFQRYSLWRSGFRIDELSLRLINKILAERDGKCDSKYEWIQLYQIFKQILEQGKKMNIDYLEELKHVCKTKLSEKLVRVEDFFDV